MDSEVPPLPERYTLSARISGAGDDWTDIEMRSDTEKYTVASVEDRFAQLFLATPKLLAACEPFLSEVFVNGPTSNGGYRSFPDDHPLLYVSGNIQDTGLTFGDVRRLADLVRSLARSEPT